MAIQDMKLFFPEGLCCAKCQVLEEDKVSLALPEK